MDGQAVFTTFLGQPAEFDDEALKNSVTLATLQQLNLPLVPDVVEGKVDYWLAKTLMSRAANLFSLIERGGWYSADAFLTWLRKKLDEGQARKFSEMTLQQFYAATKRDVSLIASDTSAGQMVVLNHNTTPDLPVVWAVRMSMSIPLLWPEVEWQTSWGNYQDKDIVGHLMVDGGMLSNFPIELFISTEDHIVKIMGEQQGGRVLGFLIDENVAVENAPALSSSTNKQLEFFGQMQLIQRFSRLVNTATGAHDKTVMEAFNQFVVYLPAQGYGTTEFDMSNERREALLVAGQQAMSEYLDFRDDAHFAIGDDPYYEFDIASHADRVANQIFG